MLFKYTCVFLLVLISSQNGGAQNARIVGGENAKIGQFKFAVSLREKGQVASHVCGGSLIKKDTVLTSAHCVVDNPDPKLYEVGVGIISWTDISVNNTLEVTNITIHKNYDPKTNANAIALLTVRPIGGGKANHTGEPIELNNSTVKDNANCTVLGWGDTYAGSQLGSPDLKYVNVPIIPTKNCSEMYAKMDIILPADDICAGVQGKDSCEGDTGGPLVCDGKLAGIVQFGFDCAKQLPGIYTDVSKYSEWIKESVKDDNDGKGNGAPQQRIAILAIICSTIVSFFITY